MKYRLAILLSVFCFLAPLQQAAAVPTDLVVSNNTMFFITGDSYLQSDGAAGPNGPVTGYRFPDYLESFFQLGWPTNNTSFMNASESGAHPDKIQTNNIAAWAPAYWAYTNNNNQHVCLVSPTDNNSFSSNQMYLSMSNIFQGPGLMSGGDFTLNSYSGWLANHAGTFKWYGLGDPPILPGGGGTFSAAARNDGSVAAGNNLGAGGLEFGNVRTNNWAQDNINSPGGTNGPNIGVVWVPAPHFIGGGNLDWAIMTAYEMTHRTNINMVVMNWDGSGTVTSNADLSNISKSGNTLSFKCHYWSYPMAWDHPDGTITNNADGAFALEPTNANIFQCIIRVPDIPQAATYNISVGGTNIASNLPGTVLAAGWNWFTNTTGPLWDKRKETLGRIRDKDWIDRVTLLQKTPNHQGVWSYMNDAGQAWQAGKRGDALINDSQTTNTLNNVFSLNALIATAAAPDDFNIAISQNVTHFAPAHR